MLSLVIKIYNIDYSAVSNKIIPVILESKAGDEKSGKLIQLLSKYKNLSGIAASAALKVLPQSAKDDISIFLIKSYESQLTDAINNFMKSKTLNIEFKSIVVTKSDSIEAAFNVDNINYNELIMTAYPLIVDKYTRDTKFSKLFSILEKLDGYSEKLIMAALETLSQEEKDEMAMLIISTYEQEIISSVNAFANGNGLKITFNGAEMRKD